MQTFTLIPQRAPRWPRILTAAALLALTLPVAASTYNVQHNFNLRPRGNVVPQVQAVYYAHAWARTVRPDCTDWAVLPAAQPPAWGAFGTDRLVSQGRVRHRNGGASDATQARVAVGAGGMALTTWTADAQGCASAKAQANSQISVNAFGAGTPITGVIRSFGFATAKAPPPRLAESYAFSMAMVEARGGRLMKNGTIRWGKVVRDVVSGSTRERRQVDPIEYTVENLVTGETFTGTLFTVTVDLPASSTGGFVWENDRIEVTASNMTFHAGFPSDKTTLQGELLIEVANGVVTNVVATGHYASAAPAPGAPVPFTLDVPNDIEFDYDLGDFGDDELDVGLGFSGAGEATEVAQSDIPWLTILTPDDSTLVIEYFLTELPWVLESAPQLTTPTHWSPVTVTPTTVDDRVIYRLPRDPSAPHEFFRLRPANPDTEPPTFRPEPQCGSPTLVVGFSEPVTPASAENRFNYQLMVMPVGTVQVLNAQMLTPQSVRLQLNQPLLPGAYQLFVHGVTDLAGNAVPPGSAAPFFCPPGAQ